MTMNLASGMENASTWLTPFNISASNHFKTFLTQEERAILTVVFSFLSLLGLLGNGLVVYAVISLGCHISLDVPANLFILSQAIADLGTALSIPIFIIHIYIWNWDMFYVYTSFVWLASLGSLFLLTLNRLLSVVDSLKYPRRMTPFRAKVLVVVIWIVPLFTVPLHHLISVLASINYPPNVGRYYIVLLTVCVVLFNAYMFRESRIQARKIKRQNRVVTGLQRNLKEDFKSMKTLALVGGTFLLSCLPFTMVVFVYGDDKKSTRFQRSAAFWGPLMAVNSVLDPVIYCFRSSEFRSFYQRFKRLHGGRRTLDCKVSPSVFKAANRRVKTRIHCLETN